MNRRISRIAAAGIVAGVVVSGAGLAGAGHLNPLLETDLSGRNEVATDAKSNKNVGDPNGRGEGYVFGIDPDRVGGVEVDNNLDTLCYIVIVDKIADLDLNPGAPRAAHIHRGVEGENGPVVANLAFPTDGQAADCLSEDEDGKFTEAAGPGIVQDILANPGEYYFNVHNSEYPAGAVRGQLEPQGHDHD